MRWHRVPMGEFLKHRDLRFKPKDQHIIGLKRIEKIDFSGNIFISDKLSNTDMILVKKGDLVISGINVEKGALAIYQSDVDLSATIHYSSYEFNKTKIDEEFLKFFLKSEEFVNAIKEQVPGGIKTEIKPKHLLPLKVNIPIEVDDQRRIVTSLQTKNSKIETIEIQYSHQLDLLKKLRQQLFQDAVQGKLVLQDPNDEPASKLLETIKAENTLLFKEKKFIKDKALTKINQDEIEFKIPDKWEWCRLGEIADLNGRIGWKGLSASEYKNAGPLFLSVHSLNYGDYVDYSQAFHISQERYDESPEIMLKNSDILICKDGAGIGKLGIVEDLKEQATVNSSLLIIRCNLKLNVKYIYYYLLSGHFQNIVYGRIMGATTPHLYQRDLVNFLVALPPSVEQNKIVAKVEQLIKICDELEQTIRGNLNFTQELLQVALKEALEPNKS